MDGLKKTVEVINRSAFQSGVNTTFISKKARIVIVQKYPREVQFDVKKVISFLLFAAGRPN